MSLRNGEKLFGKRKTPLSRAQAKRFGTRGASKRIPFLSLAGQTVIVNRAILPASDLGLSAPSQEKIPSDMIAESLPATVA